MLRLRLNFLLCQRARFYATPVQIVNVLVWHPFSVGKEPRFSGGLRSPPSTSSITGTTETNNVTWPNHPEYTSAIPSVSMVNLLPSCCLGEILPTRAQALAFWPASVFHQNSNLSSNVTIVWGGGAATNHLLAVALLSFQALSHPHGLDLKHTFTLHSDSFTSSSTTNWHGGGPFRTLFFSITIFGCQKSTSLLFIYKFFSYWNHIILLIFCSIVIG